MDVTQKPGTHPNRVRELREDRLMTQAQLARKARVALRTIHSVEKGMNCRMDTKRKILLALGMRFEDKDQVFPQRSPRRTATPPASSALGVALRRPAPRAARTTSLSSSPIRARTRRVPCAPMDRVTLLADVAGIVSRSHDLDETLGNVVDLVAKRLDADVCSVYLTDTDLRHLTLRATRGLAREAIGRVRLAFGEGLVGLTAKSGAPMATEDAQAHPAYRYFPETGEERFSLASSPRR